MVRVLPPQRGQRSQSALFMVSAFLLFQFSFAQLLVELVCGAGIHPEPHGSDTKVDGNDHGEKQDAAAPAGLHPMITEGHQDDDSQHHIQGKAPVPHRIANDLHPLRAVSSFAFAVI